MLEFAHVSAGEIDIGPCPLPHSWNLVSGLDALSQTELANLGWLPVEDSAAPLGPWEELDSPVLTVDGSRVVRHFPAKRLPDALIVTRLRDAVQAHMDIEAQRYGYDDIKTAVTYADEPAVKKFQVEGAAFRAWRSLVWAACYDHMDAVADGTVAIPDSTESLLAILPILNIDTSS